MQKHTIPPFYDENSRTLILGSFPSVKSREVQFYYGHPQNRFWKVLAGICSEEVPVTVEQKKFFLAKHHIALWDVIAGCEIQGSSDSSISLAEPNPIASLVKQTSVEHILINGKKAYQLFCRFFKAEDFPTVYPLPSTSPANASWGLEQLIVAWKAAFCSEV